jgi:hypothetical protein
VDACVAGALSVCANAAYHREDSRCAQYCFDYCLTHLSATVTLSPYAWRALLHRPR